jgi:hypothetical protein
LFLGNQFPAEHSLCEEVTVLPRQGMEGIAVKKWHKRKNTGKKLAANLHGVTCQNYNFVGK